MRTARALGVAFPLILLVVLLGACGGDDEGEEAVDEGARVAAAAFGARLLTVGEPLGTIVDSRVQAIVPGLQLALNPDAVATIAGAVEDGDERLNTIAEAAGMTPEEFSAAWTADRVAAFSRFASGLAAAEDPRALRDELFIDELTALPVHPDGVLLGTGRIDRPDGEQGYFLIYDVPLSTVETETAVGRQLDQSPWQVTGGQSNTDMGFFRFQSTINADIEGVVWVLPLPSGSVGAPLRVPLQDGDADEADGGNEAGAAGGDTQATVVYLIEVQPAMQREELPFVLPDGRPLPDGFPAEFLLEGEQTVTQLLWNSVPGGSAYQLLLLTRASAFDVADIYRDRIVAQGWEVTSDEAIGFATVLNFASEDGLVQGSASFDAFEDDEDYTQIVLQVQATSGQVN